MGSRIALAGLAVLLAAAASACAADGDEDAATSGSAATVADPVAGWRFLANGGYIGVGIPAHLFYDLEAGRQIPVLGDVGGAIVNVIFPILSGQAIGPTEVPGREGANANLSYRFTEFTSARGNRVVNFTCLTCHTGVIDGKAIVGLGDTLSDYTGDLGFAARSLLNVAKVAGSDDDVEEATVLTRRFEAIAPYVKTTTVGANPAINLTYALIAHRDPKTMAWSDTPLLPPPPEVSLPYDVPAWWHMKRRSTAFMSGEVHVHQGTIMLASLLGSESVADVKRWDKDFANALAFIKTLEAPRYPLPIDTALAARGKPTYDRACASCHGSYGARTTYPERVIPLAEIGTDPEQARQEIEQSSRFYAWIDASPYAHAPNGRTEAGAPLGYLAPPLDGVWATAPYLHNGSVPTLEGVLDSSKRPAAWTRFGQFGEYDTANMGVKYVWAPGKTLSAFLAKYVYDTREKGYGNAGHTYGDALSADDRRALLEYLKTL